MKVVIVGGVAGGASTAARLRRLDESAEVVVLERDHYVSYANCGLPYHIGGVIAERDKLLVQTPAGLRASLNIDVRTGHEVVAVDRGKRRVTVRIIADGNEYEESYDKLVLAQGAQPIRPPLPGIDLKRVFVLRNIPDMDAIVAALHAGATSAVVIGGGYIGVETAECLHHRGLSVDLVEMQPQIMPPLDCEMARALELHMASHHVALHLGTGAAGFEEIGSGIRTVLSNGRQIDADLVVLAAGVRPESGLARRIGITVGVTGGIRVDRHMRTSDPDIYAVGDMVEVTDLVTEKPALVALAGPANRQGRIAADHICGRDSRYTATQGTAVVKVFDMTGGATGAGERGLQAAGREYAKVHLHPSGHASYYPGTAPMQMKVLFDPGDGRLLGAQVVGFDGVDKRIDVLATAIRSGLSVFDLEHLELAYAPPYGSAKDPVNMAGFIAANVLRGDLRLWYAEDYPDRTGTGLIVDVRSPAEHREWAIPGAINIPLTALRSRLSELPRDRPLFVHCRVGFRGYLACRILTQSGFPHVYNLSGGALTFSCVHPTVYSNGSTPYSFIAHAEDQVAEGLIAAEQ